MVLFPLVENCFGASLSNIVILEGTTYGSVGSLGLKCLVTCFGVFLQGNLDLLILPH